MTVRVLIFLLICIFAAIVGHAIAVLIEGRR